ncbi:hypothetical protein QR98_0036640 [Sarcoptes scabiei]|uniref:Uncharacterized protein n=1 Tax=Sarcoptes scabiei TaxID=52283 RepID=A0A132A3L5_SARSC|nr:hypothetical protein QR98_0036640 [Sarcoptes scabiei]
MTSTVGYGKLNLPSTDFEYAVRHFRSDSIPSILERESLDTNNPNYKLDRSERNQIADDSRPPTPPVRYSSLPEHYRHKDNCRINLIATKSRNDLTLQKNSFLLNILYPKMQRGSNSSHKRNISDHQSCIDLSIKSPENIVKDRQNSRFPNERLIQMESKNGSPITAHSTASTSNTSSLKEIQKRAVYEFYLKQKDKLKQKYSKDCDHKVESQSKIDECNGKELFKFNPEHIKAPFDGSKASEASTVNDQETNEDADFPPPPLLSSSEINTDEKLPSVEEILNSRYSELMNICSEVDLTSLIPVLSVVLNDYQCLEDDESNRKDPKDSYGEEEAIEKELIEIDQTHKRKNRLMSNQSLLQMELTRIRKELQTLEDLRLIIHRRLKRIDKVIDDKFNLLSFDIIKIIELTFSLNQQMYQNVCSPSNNQSDQNHLNSLETKAKQIRLQQQLFDAEKLRDIIEKRRLLFIERIERRLNQLNDNQSPNRNEFQIGSSDFISNSRDNLSYSDIIKWCSEEEFSIQKSLLDGTTDLNISKVVECYLERLKILTIQERLVIFILQQETSDREPK